MQVLLDLLFPYDSAFLRYHVPFSDERVLPFHQIHECLVALAVAFILFFKVISDLSLPLFKSEPLPFCIILRKRLLYGFRVSLIYLSRSASLVELPLEVDFFISLASLPLFICKLPKSCTNSRLGFRILRLLV